MDNQQKYLIERIRRGYIQPYHEIIHRIAVLEASLAAAESDAASAKQGWMNQAIRDSAEIVRLECLIEKAEADQQRAVDAALENLAAAYKSYHCHTHACKECVNQAHEFMVKRVGTNPLAELQARITELEQQLEEARNDVERYRWLRKDGAWESEIGTDMLSVDPGQCDNAIDAAMTKENTHE